VIVVLDNEANLPNGRLSQSKMIAVDKLTGKIAWETPRPLNRSGWSTPMIWDHGSRKDLVVMGNGRLSGYDPSTGEEAWFVNGFSRETIAVPVSGGGHLFASAARLGGDGDAQPDPAPFWNAVLQFDRDEDNRLGHSEMTGSFTFPLRPELPVGHPGFGIPLPQDETRRRRRLDGMFARVDKDKDGFWTKDEFVGSMSFRRGRPVLMAIRPGGKGDITDSHVSWQVHRGIPEIPSPIFYDNRLFLVRKGGIVSAVDATSGKILYRERLGATGQYSASPVVANGHLYLVSNQGLVSVVRPGDRFQLVHQHDLQKPVVATPAFDESTIYIRTAEELLAFRTRS
jgi:outer membrane protein assembly factor BamB